MTQTTDKKLLPFLAALCLFLAAVEYAVPKPLPFLRLGLANLPVIVALFVMPTRDIYKLILLKIIGQALSYIDRYIIICKHCCSPLYQVP